MCRHWQPKREGRIAAVRRQREWQGRKAEMVRFEDIDFGIFCAQYFSSKVKPWETTQAKKLGAGLTGGHLLNQRCAVSIILVWSAQAGTDLTGIISSRRRRAARFEKGHNS